MSNYQTTKGFADMFKALSNPNRLQIFLQLTRCCAPGTVCSNEDMSALCVGDLGAQLDVSASTLSHHVKELNRAGLINMRRNGQNVECWIEPQILEKLAGFFTQSATE